jgi:hypothetical protein
MKKLIHACTLLSLISFASLISAKEKEKPVMADEVFPVVYGFGFGMNSAKSLEVLKKIEGLVPPNTNGKRDALWTIKTRCTQEREVKELGLRSIELTFFNDVLVQIIIFVNGDGGKEFSEVRNKIGVFGGSPLTGGQHLIKDYILKVSSNRLSIADIKRGIETKMITKFTIEQFREAWEKRKKKSGK